MSVSILKPHKFYDFKRRLIADIPAGIFLLLSALLLFLPVFMGWRGIYQNDQAISEFSRHFFLAKALQSGTLPLWQPNLWCGAIPYYSFPYSGDSYYILLWPLYLLSDLKNLDSAYWTICLLPLFLHYVIAGAGMYFLLNRGMACNRFASSLGAVAYILSPALTYSYTCEYSLIMQAWVPWLIFVYLLTVRDFQAWKVFLGAIIFAFICFGSKPHFIPFVFMAWSGFVIMLALEEAQSDGLRGIIKPFVIALLILFFGTLLSAPYLYSFLDGLRYTDQGFDLALGKALEDPAGSLSLSYLATLFIPDLFGSLTGINFIFSRLMFWYANMSAGTVITFGALIGALVCLDRKTMSNLRKYAALGVTFYLVAVLCSLGKNTPFCKLIAGWVPIFSGLPNPIRFRFLQCFATSMLVGIGIHCLICSELFIRGLKLRKILWSYASFSFFIVGLVLFLPHRTAPVDMSAEAADFKIEGFLPPGQAVGIYTPRFSRTKRIKVIFDGESEGEVRYSDSHRTSPSGGSLARTYHVFSGGLVELEVDIPANSFLWVYPRTGVGKIGYWEAKQGCFSYDRSWIISAHKKAIGLSQDSEHKNAALFMKMKNSYALDGNPLLTPLCYWLCALLILLAGVYLIPSRCFGYYLGAFILLEFLIFGFMAFYGCTFNEDNNRFREFLPHNIRAVRPTDHPMAQLMLGRLPPVAPNEEMRIATDFPFFDNYSYLNGRFSFMGEPAFPLERRFKRVLEAAYEQKMTRNVFYEGERCFPKKPRLLSNFSAGYFLSRDPRRVFPNESLVSLTANDADYFLHKDQDVLPRVYVMDTRIPATDQQQLEELLSGDLRRAVYVDSVDGLLLGRAGGKDYVARFNELQSMNPVRNVSRDNPNQLEIEVTIKKPSMLVLTDVWYPGWDATVDGNRAPIHRVNYCQRGVLLGAGIHRVILIFRPLAWRIGVGISLGTIVLMTIFLFLNRKRTTS